MSITETELRVSAAFVAASAHHVCYWISSLLRLNLDAGGIGSSALSSALLYLIADANADAIEITKHIQCENSSSLEKLLIRSIELLLSGALGELAALEIPDIVKDFDVNNDSQIEHILEYLLVTGVKDLGSTLQRSGQFQAAETRVHPKTFREIKELCLERPVESHRSDLINTLSIYPEHYHLATLLELAAEVLVRNAITNISIPADSDERIWNRYISEVGSSRPYLWRNHRAAIDAGYLQPGTSAVISFPTGAGKSTLSELKIASALSRGLKAIFLAPTLALVDQTARALSRTFHDVEMSSEDSDDIDLESGLSNISVMTPERCLALLTFDSTSFSDVGLLVFDECHLMHAAELNGSRRALDAMLSILYFAARAPDADFLFLSAMMANTAEVAGWVHDLTGRRCLSLDLHWKPTRQVRGCVVFPSSEIQALTDELQKANRQTRTKNAPAAVKKTLFASPHGLFCLSQTWVSTDRENYSLLPLLEKQLLLSVGNSSIGNKWYLTPNANSVAAGLATSSARQGIKTLIFCQTIPAVISTARAVSNSLEHSSIKLTDDEERHLAQAIEELGGEQHLYLTVQDSNTIDMQCVVHHALLLPSERRIHESLLRELTV